MPYIITLVLVSAVASVLTASAWRHRTAPGAPAFALLMLTVVIWSLAYALELSSAALPAKLFWTRIEYLGIVILPAAWLAFACHYTGYDSWLGRRAMIALAIEPLVILLLIWTNEWHSLFWRTITLAPGDPLFAWHTTRGVAYWVHAGYTYLLLLGGTILLIGALLRTPQLYRGQAAWILLSAFVPWVSNGLYLAGVNPLAPLELTPFAFLITGLVLAWAVFRFQLLALIPLARERVIEELVEGMLVLDQDDRIVDVNPAACQLLGRTARAIIGQPASVILAGWPMVLTPDRASGPIQAEVAVVEGARPRYFELRSAPLHTHTGRVTGRVIVVHEITARKEAEVALVGAKAAAEAASRAKSTFLATMSHELRTPLTVILGLSELLHVGVYGALTAKQSDITDQILRSGHHLVILINEVLDLAKIEAGTMELYLEEVDITTQVNAIATTLVPLIEQQGNTLTVHSSTGLGAMRTDPIRLRQVLYNLVHNANKFTTRGQIIVIVRVEAATNTHGPSWDEVVVFEVRDTGIGITPEQQQQLFQPFSQTDAVATRQYGGIGLGLAVSRAICQLLGGDIQVQSTLGQGTTFTVRVPRTSNGSPVRH